MRTNLIAILICLNSIFAQNYKIDFPEIKSLILPGWGEMALGKSDHAYKFYKNEALLWLYYLGALSIKNWYESDYVAFAELHADANMKNKSYLFAVNLGHYDSIEDYNDHKELQRLPEEKYDLNEYSWYWDSQNNRILYDSMRIRAFRARKNTKFAIGGMVLHRLISLIDVIYIKRKNTSISLTPSINNELDNIGFQVIYKF